VVEKLLGPERASLAPAVVTGLSAALQGAMGVVFWAVAAIAAAAVAVSFAFPKVAAAPPVGAPAAGDAAP
jgi:hypothetical protein